MDNSSAFDLLEIKRVLDGFMPSMRDPITPIKYEALSPDLFCFMLRIRDHKDKDSFYALLTFDLLSHLAEAKEIIEEWSNAKLLKFLEPAGPTHTFTSKDAELSRYATGYDGSPYYSLMAQITRPNDNSFWATYMTIHPGEDLADKIIDWSDEEKRKIIEAYLTSGWSLSHYDSSFHNPLGQTSPSTDPNGDLMKNNTNYIITWFKNRDGNWELMLDGPISNS